MVHALTLGSNSMLRAYMFCGPICFIIFRCKVQATNKVTTSLARYDSNVYGDRAVDDSKDRLIF